MSFALQHVSLAVTDLARSRHFDGTILGLEELPRPAFAFAGAWYAAGPGQVHLIVAEQPRALRGTREIDSHDGHFALRIDDYEAMLERLRSFGVEVIERRANVTPWSQLHLTDPDGNGIELNVERPAQP